jgi:cyclophilin family peptidyl-prolyl cis-trans isomerase
MRRFSIIFLALIALIALLAGACSSATGTPTPTPALTSAPTPVHTPTATQTPPPTPTIKVYSAPPPMTIDQNKQYTATIKTNYGDIVVELFPKDAPLAVNNFVFLARQGFYDWVKFHRVVKGFVIQSGDPTGTGMGGPGYKFADEPVTRDYVPGTLAMANSGPNTNGSQFFITLADLSGQLPKKYTIFGLVTSGFDVVQEIGNVPCKANPSLPGEISVPTVDVHINSISIEEN